MKCARGMLIDRLPNIAWKRSAKHSCRAFELTKPHPKSPNLKSVISTRPRQSHFVSSQGLMWHLTWAVSTLTLVGRLTPKQIHIKSVGCVVSAAHRILPGSCALYVAGLLRS